jgi:hypothetical protein
MATRWKYNSWILPLFAVAGGLVVYFAFLLAPRLNSINAGGSSSRASILEQGDREIDRNFLDDLARENNQNDHGDGNHFPVPDPQAVKTGSIVDNLKAVPRAEVVGEIENERPKAKVVHGRTPKLKRQTKAGSEVISR